MSTEWIDAKERLPEEKVDVLVLTTLGCAVAYYELLGTRPDWYTGNAVTGSDAEIGGRVTHWMELPEAPNA